MSKLKDKVNSTFFSRSYGLRKKIDDYIVNPNKEKSFKAVIKRYGLLTALSLVIVLIVGFYAFIIPTKDLPYVDPLNCVTNVASQFGNGTTTRPVSYRGVQAEHHDRYTLIIPTFNRPALIQKAVKHYATCKEVDAIRVMWTESPSPPVKSAVPEFFSEDKDVRYDLRTDTSLNGRFYPIEGIRTEAVFSMDDDMIVPCADLRKAFEEWKLDKWNLVGLYPRLHLRLPDCSYRYMVSYDTFIRYGQYSMVSTKAAMFHRDYLEHYTSEMPKGIREYVSAGENCEDLAIQILVANMTHAAPRFVHSRRAVDWGKGVNKVQGISSAGQGHLHKRDLCLNEFAKYYGGALPLVNHRIESLSDRLTPVTEFLYGLLAGRF